MARRRKRLRLKRQARGIRLPEYIVNSAFDVDCETCGAFAGADCAGRQTRSMRDAGYHMARVIAAHKIIAERCALPPSIWIEPLPRRRRKSGLISEQLGDAVAVEERDEQPDAEHDAPDFGDFGVAGGSEVDDEDGDQNGQEHEHVG